AKNASKSGSFELEIVLSERGKTRFNAAAALGRDRKYCVVAAGSLRNCSDFTPSEKSRSDQSLVATGLDRGEARLLAGSLESAIRSEEAAVKAAEIETRVVTPRELLDLLYGRAVRNRGPDWIGGDEREAFLIRDLVDLWDRVDVARAAGNNDTLLSSD